MESLHEKKETKKLQKDIKVQKKEDLSEKYADWHCDTPASDGRGCYGKTGEVRDIF